MNHTPGQIPEDPASPAEQPTESLRAERIEAMDSQIGAVYAHDAALNGSMVGAVVGTTITVRQSFVGILVADKVEGQFTVLISTTGAVILGGLTLGAIVLTRFLRRT